MNRLVEKYQKTVIESLMKQFNYSSVMQCPKIEKVVINMGVGDAIANPKACLLYTSRPQRSVSSANSAARQ